MEEIDVIGSHLRISTHGLGFTLIEMMVAVVVMALLAAIAYPGFVSEIRQSRRSDAIQALAALQQAQERWRSAHSSYAASGALTSAWPGGLGQAGTSPGGHYNIAIATSPAPDASSYTATASGATGSSQESDQAGTTSCKTLTLSVTNGNATYAPAACWSR